MGLYLPQSLPLSLFSFYYTSICNMERKGSYYFTRETAADKALADEQGVAARGKAKKKCYCLGSGLPIYVEGHTCSQSR